MKSDIRLLQTVKVTAPCNASWEEMSGNEQTRYCRECKLYVHNLSAMSRRDAENLLRQFDGRGACIRVGRRQDGSIITDNCPRHFRPVRALLLKSLATVMSFGLLLFTFTARSAQVIHRHAARRQSSAKTAGSNGIDRKPLPKIKESPSPSNGNSTHPPQTAVTEVGQSAARDAASDVNKARPVSGAVFTTGFGGKQF